MSHAKRWTAPTEQEINRLLTDTDSRRSELESCYGIKKSHYRTNTVRPNSRMLSEMSISSITTSEEQMDRTDSSQSDGVGACRVQ